MFAPSLSVLSYLQPQPGLHRRKKKPKQDAYLAGVSDRKLKGQLKHTERLYKEANKAAAHINQWLAPAEAGFVEAEGAGFAISCCCQQQHQPQH
jgi:hypothetical protein